MRHPKAQSLASFYAALSTAEIERRIARGGLTDLALTAARDELAARRAGRMPEAPATPVAPPSDHVLLLAGSAAAVVACVMLYLMAPAHVFLLATTVVMPIVATVLGKAMPKVGLVLGVALVATPLWLGGLMASAGALTFQQGDYKPLGALISYVLLVIGSLLGIACGSSLLRGASHHGSWPALWQELSAQRKQVIAAITRRR